MKKRLVPASLILVTALGVTARTLPSSAPPAYSLAGKVVIRRDTYGIPHILAETEEAAAFGLGYAQAEDHCLTIARSLVAARGEEAKYFGTGKESDFLVRLYNVREEAERDLRRVSRLYRRIVNAYAMGVNRYVERHRAELPDWIPAFTGADLMAARRAGAVRSAFSQAAVRALERKYPQARAAGPARSAVPLGRAGDDASPVEEDGSNAFALAGTRTVSGHPILLGNPHLNWSSLYWEAQVTVPGKIDFFGSTLAGIPVLRAGFNRHLGWVTTNNAPDVSDIFALELDRRRPDHYIFNGRSRPLVKREISVDVRGPDGRLTQETRTYWESHLGKIIYRTAERAFAVASTQIDAVHYYEGFYLLSKTRTLGEFLGVMRRNLVPTSNFTYADAQGNIMYMWNARIARRPDDGTDYSLDVPGSTGRYVWKKMLPVSSFPALLNPRGGYTQNCNNPPWYASLRDPIDPRRYPSYLEQERGLALRPQIALEMLESRERFSLDDAVALKFETRMLLADRVKPALVAALGSAPALSEELAAGLRALQSWDNRVAAESRGAVLFQRFWDTYSRAVEQPYAAPWDPQRPAQTPYGLADTAAALKHLEDAVRWCRQTYGSEDVAWGEVHRFRFGALDLPGDGADGTYGLFRVVRFQELPGGKRVAGRIRENEPPVGFGDAWVLAVEFSQPVRAYSILAYGQTTRSASPHSSDQIGLFASHRLRPVWFTEEEIRANLESEYRP